MIGQTHEHNSEYAIAKNSWLIWNDVVILASGKLFKILPIEGIHLQKFFIYGQPFLGRFMPFEQLINNHNTTSKTNFAFKN